MSVGEFYTNVSRKGNNILLMGYDADGNRVKDRIKFRPTLYTTSEAPSPKWKSLYGQPLDEHRFDTMTDARDFIKMYDGVHGFEIHGQTKYVPAYIQSQYPGKIEYDLRLINVARFDIETSYSSGFPDPAIADEQILTIAMRTTRSAGTIVWGMKDYVAKKGVEYRKFRTETAMLEDFLEYWCNDYPDVVTGWNVRFFDIPFLVNRVARILGQSEAKRFSPWGLVNQKEVPMHGRIQVTFDMDGLAILDYLELYKKFSHTPQSSYKLDYIAEQVLGQNKLDYSQYEGLSDMYDRNFQMFVDYNIHDVELIDRLEDKLGMIKLVFLMAYKAGANYQDALGTTSIWDALIFRRLADKHVAVPITEASAKATFAGGYVKEVIPGMYDYVVSFDLNSLYPNLIIQYNMSPETIVKREHIAGMSPDRIIDGSGLKVIEENGTNLAIAANGAAFSKNKVGIIPEIIRELYNERRDVKNEMLRLEQEQEVSGNVNNRVSLLNMEQMALKIFLNSLYGAMGNVYFRYFDLDIAEAVTLTGQTVIRWAERVLNNYLNKALKTEDKDYVIAIDTDSVYLNMADIVKMTKPKDPITFIDRLCSEVLEGVLEKAFNGFAEKTSAFSNEMVMAREVIADRGVWTAKKRYILNVHDKEGVRYKEPKLKIMGVEAIKSSTPKVCQKAMKDVFALIMNASEGDVQKYIANFRDEFKKLPLEQIAVISGVNNLSDFARQSTIYKKGTPMHVRASLVYNNAIKQAGLDKKYELIGSGDKMSMIYLHHPNPVRENVIGFSTVLPPELNLDKYIDYDALFERVFLKPIEIILDSIKWNSECTSTLDDFFV